MRRKDREQTAEFAWDVLERCPYGVLSLVDREGAPYAVPVSHAVLNGAVYFHSAKHGEKTKIMAANPAACLTGVTDVVPLPEQYSTTYASAVACGVVSLVEDADEWTAALRAIVERYASENAGHFEDALAKSSKRTAVWKLTPTAITGKARLA
ncbi:pyridoxamine 5'-phosphate oxidase family protein [Adlercreutzia sp. ZJ138]|uniref:pyridoxamine 5'-phosphate oxidase family protein n=1 Tax=Adlercreutzia sp. ZJ138 TaxID=2709405 RepID=UPI0013ECEB2F|nr:pyridoxamine 5'-phosphate oxidase family protein [Adlercreutzia sp. ZJ138]